jgi:hypothetical protein
VARCQLLNELLDTTWANALKDKRKVNPRTGQEGPEGE